MSIRATLHKLLPAHRRTGNIRMAIVGSSHIAALKVAMKDGLVDTSGFDISFFGAPGSHFKKMTFHEGLIHSVDADMSLIISDGRYTALPIQDFDVILFHGRWISYIPLLFAFSNIGMNPNRVSKAFKSAVTETIIPAMLHKFPVPLEVARTKSVLVLTSSTPLKAQASGVLSKTEAEQTRLDDFEPCYRAILADHNMHYLPQPAETIIDNVYTRNEFSIGSTRLDGDLNQKHRKNDFAHMNGKYGALVMRDAMKQARDLLGQAQDSPV